MTPLQGWIIIGLLALIAVSTTAFMAEDLYFTIRAARMRRKDQREALERDYQAQKDWERGICPDKKRGVS